MTRMLYALLSAMARFYRCDNIAIPALAACIERTQVHEVHTGRDAQEIRRLRREALAIGRQNSGDVRAVPYGSLVMFSVVTKFW